MELSLFPTISSYWIKVVCATLTEVLLWHWQVPIKTHTTIKMSLYILEACFKWCYPQKNGETLRSDPSKTSPPLLFLQGPRNFGLACLLPILPKLRLHFSLRVSEVATLRDGEFHPAQVYALPRLGPFLSLPRSPSHPPLPSPWHSTVSAGSPLSRSNLSSPGSGDVPSPSAIHVGPGARFPGVTGGEGSGESQVLSAPPFRTLRARRAFTGSQDGGAEGPGRPRRRGGNSPSLRQGQRLQLLSPSPPAPPARG